jgi:hypothetical protein
MNNLSKFAAVGSLILGNACSQEGQPEQADSQAYNCIQTPRAGEAELTSRSDIEGYCKIYKHTVLSCLSSGGFPKDPTVGYGKVACNDSDLPQILDYLFSPENKVTHSCVTGGMPQSMSCSEIKVKISPRSSF